jgi:hypothetical protein
VCVIDVFHNVFEAKLKGMTNNPPSRRENVP